MRFEEAYSGWGERRLTQAQAAQLLGVCTRTFRRTIHRYEDEGLDGLLDQRMSRISHRPPISACPRLDRGPGMLLHQSLPPAFAGAGFVKTGDGSTHEWVADQTWDLIVTMDNATSEPYSMFFCEEEGTHSSFVGVREVIERHGLFCSLYTDRASHYWITPEAGGKGDKNRLTPFWASDEAVGGGDDPGVFARSAGGARSGLFGLTRACPRESGGRDLDQPWASAPDSIRRKRRGIE